MKKLLSILLLSTLCLTAYSRSVTLDWWKNKETNVIGYFVYFGSESEKYTNCAFVLNRTNHVVSGLVEGIKYFFTVTAYDGSLESEKAKEIWYIIPPTNRPPIAQPLNIISNIETILVFQVYPATRIQIQSSEDLIHWNIVVEELRDDDSDGLIQYRMFFDRTRQRLYFRSLYY